MPEDLPDDHLLTRLAVMEPGRLRPIIDRDEDPSLRAVGLDIAAQGWEQSADSWAKQMQPGDELWSWSSPGWTWKNLCGRGGLALVRGGKAIDYSVTVMN